MEPLHPTYGVTLGETCHRSFFREAIAVRAPKAPEGSDPAHEHLIDQANLRGFRGAVAVRDTVPELDPSLTIEDIAVGLLQPHAPAEPRIVKLVTGILQSDEVDLGRLVFRAKRERALPVLAWIVDLIPETEVNVSVRDLRDRIRRDPPRDTRRPNVRYDSARLFRRRPA